MFAVESLEKRFCLSGVSVATESYTAIAVSSASVPWAQTGLTATGNEQLVGTAVSPVTGVRAVLTQVQEFMNPTSPFGTTPQRLYLSADNGTTWYETDYNPAFDGHGHPSGSDAARYDSEMAMDGEGNLFICNLSTLVVDRIPESMVQDLATGQPITPYSTTQILDPNNVAAMGTGNLRPQLAVGSLASDPTKTTVYIFDGEASPGQTVTTTYAWQGTISDSFSSPNNGGLWHKMTSAASLGIGAVWAPMTVGGDGNLYTTNGSDVYSLSPTATTFTQLFALPPAAILSVHTVSNALAAYTPTGGTTMLFALTKDSNSKLTVATTPVSGSGAGTWTFAPVPVDPVDTDVTSPILAVDPATGQVSVLYENSSSNSLTVAYEHNGVWLRKLIASGISFSSDVGVGPNNFGNDRTFIDGYSVYNGYGSVAYTQNDATLSPSQEDVVQISVDLTSATGEQLTITNAGVTAGDTIDISDPTGGGDPIVTLNGVTQTYSTSLPVVDIIINAINSPTMTIDTSNGNPTTPFGTVTVNGQVTDYSWLIIDPGSQASTQRFSASQLSMNDLVVNLSNIYWVDVEGTGSQTSSVTEALPYTLSLDDTSSPCILNMDCSSSLSSWTAIDIPGTTHNTTINLTATTGNDVVKYLSSIIRLNGRGVAVCSGVQTLNVNGNGGNDALQIYKPIASNSSLTDTASSNAEIDVETPNADALGDGKLPNIFLGSGATGTQKYQIDYAGTYSLRLPSSTAAPLDVVVDGGASVTLNQRLSSPESYLDYLLVSNGAVSFYADPSSFGPVHPTQIGTLVDDTTVTTNGDLTVDSLSIGATGLLDLGSSKLIGNYSANPSLPATIRGYLASGYNGGAWNGYGIISSLAAADYTTNGSSAKLALGYADSADGIVTTMDPDTFEVVLTYYGDANLDYTVDLTDYNILASNYNQSSMNWDQGDFNYDGTVGLADYNIQAAHFGQTYTP
jgi:hypothetical protein